MNKTIKLAFSPCPNDTFIFDALVHKRIDTEGLDFEFFIDDVEALNKMAFGHKFEVSKMSFHAYVLAAEAYVCQNSGAAFCDNFGPVVVARNDSHADTKPTTVAVPGLHTTAALLYKIFFGDVPLTPYLFTEIENVVASGKADRGIIIHENVFTFQNKGLIEIDNLGKRWQNTFGLPVPLGCIAVSRKLDKPLQLKIDKLIKESILYALNHPDTAMPFIKKNAANLDEKIIKKHIETYVNAYSLALDNKARKAVRLIFEKSFDMGIINALPETMFLP